MTSPIIIHKVIRQQKFKMAPSKSTKAKIVMYFSQKLRKHGEYYYYYSTFIHYWTTIDGVDRAQYLNSKVCDARNVHPVKVNTLRGVSRKSTD